MSSAASAPESCPELVMLGHIVRETIHFPDRTLGPVLGSPVAYGSVLAGRLGVRAGIVTIVGTDIPPALLAPFAEANVDTRGLQIRPGDWTTISELVYDTLGNKEIRYPRKAPPITFDDIPAAYHRAGVFYVATMDHDLPIETIQRLARATTGIRAVDLGGYGGAHSERHPSRQEQRDPATLRELVRLCHVVRASLEDCGHLFGVQRLADEAAEQELVRQLVAWGALVALLTLGERGCLVGTANGVHHVPAARGRVVDTTGAGDVFSTAFLIGYMHTGDPVWSARFGAAAVIHVIEHTGGVRAERMPTRAQVDERLRAPA